MENSNLQSRSPQAVQTAIKGTLVIGDNYSSSLIATAQLLSTYHPYKMSPCTLVSKILPAYEKGYTL